MNGNTIYDTGTVAVTNGSTTVTGTGAAWLTNAPLGGDIMLPDGKYYIASVTGENAITLERAYEGTTATGGAYTLYKTTSLATAAANIASVAASYKGVAFLTTSDKYWKLNKASSADNAGVWLQTAGVDKVRYGAFGSDDYKVQWFRSSDNTWQTALTVAADDGAVTLSGTALSGLAPLASPSFTTKITTPAVNISNGTHKDGILTRTQTSPHDYINYDAVGTTGGWSGAHRFRTSTSEGTLHDQLILDDTNGVTLPASPAADDSSLKLATTAYVVGQAASVAPLVNGTAAVGTSKKYARQDHVHPSNAPISIPSGRLSLSSTSALPTTDITGSSAATIWYVDCGGGGIPVWDNASGAWIMRSFSGALSLALDSNSAHTLYHAADNVFDVYAYWDATLGSLRLGTTNIAGYDLVNRSNGNISNVVQKSGIWVNTLNGYLRINSTGNTAGTDYIQPGVNQATYLGSIGTVAAGQSEDSVARRLVFNAYNTKPRHAFKKFTGTGYLYTSVTFRQVNADATMQVEVLIGLNGVMAETEAEHFATCSVAPAAINTAIGIGSTTPISVGAFGSYGRIVDTSGGWPTYFRWKGYPGLGRIVFKWLESGTASGTGAGFLAASDQFRNGVSVKAEI